MLVIVLVRDMRHGQVSAMGYPEYGRRPRARRQGRAEREIGWLRETALERLATLKRWLVHPATVLGILHFIVLLWVRSQWRAAIHEYGLPVGPQADLAASVVSWLDLGVNWLCESIAYGDGHGPAHGVYVLISFFGVRSHADLALGLHWPLLLLLGTVQWAAIGFAIAFVRGRRRA